MTRSRGRQAVYIGILPTGFKPQRPWDIPPSLSELTLFEKNLPMCQAQGYCRVFNKRSMLERSRRWAIVSKHLKANRHGEHPDARRARKEREKGGVS